MIWGLPWESWLLLLASVGIGLAIELAFLRNQRRRRQGRRDAAAPEGPEATP